MTDSDILLSENADGVATLTLNRPLQYNALSDELLDALISELDVIANDEHIKVVILAANGKAFCAGFASSAVIRFGLPKTKSNARAPLPVRLTT